MAIRSSVLILCIAAMVFAAGKPADRNYRVGIVSFTAKTGTAAAEAEVIEEMFRNGLVQSKKYDVLDRSNMKEVLKEQEFQQTGCTDTDCAVKIGKILNMEFMIYGSIMKMGSSYLLSIGMVNVETSKIENTAQQKFATMDTADSAVQKIVASLTGVQSGSTDTSQGTGRTIMINVPGRGVTNYAYQGTTMFTYADTPRYAPNPLKTTLFIVSPLVFTGGALLIMWEYLYGPLFSGSPIGSDTTLIAYNNYLNANDNISLAWQQYSDAVLWRNVRVIGGGALIAAGIGTFIWALMIPDTPMKTAVIPYLKDDGFGVFCAMRF